MPSEAGKYRKRVPLYAIGIVLILGAVIWFVGGILVDHTAQRIWMGKEVFQEMPFDRQKWHNYKRYEPVNVRKRMFHDLQAHHLKSGMSRSEVIKLLGKPEKTRSKKIYYYLGPDAIKIDTNELVVEFDGHWKLTKVYWNET